MSSESSPSTQLQSGDIKSQDAVILSKYPGSQRVERCYHSPQPKNNSYRRLFIIFIALVMWPISPTATLPFERALVLVTGVYSNIKPMAPNELRKLFLGVPIYKGSRKLVPLLNMTDKFVHEVFLQKIVFMSADIYDNQLTSRRTFDRNSILSINQLRKLLISKNNSVSYMWRENAQIDPRLKVIQTLWTVQK